MWKWIKDYFMPQYVSELDKFMQDFDRTHPQSEVQRKETEKYRRLSQKRDQENII